MSRPPNPTYNPLSQDRMASSAGFQIGFDPTSEEAQQARKLRNHAFRQEQKYNDALANEANANKPVLKPKERGYAHGQKMGHSNIIFGDAGGEPTIGGKKIKPKVSRNYPNNQAFGASNIVGSGVSAGGAGAPQPKSRTYPGGQTFGYSQVSSSIVPPELPRPKVVTKMGQSSLTLNGAPRSESPERKPAKAASVPLGQRMGHSNLGAGGVPTEKPKAPVKPSKMLESSADPRAFQHPVRRKKPFYKPADPAVEEPEEEAEEVLGVQVTEPYPVPNWQKMDKGSKLRWAHRNPDKWDAYVAKR